MEHKINIWRAIAITVIFTFAITAWYLFRLERNIAENNALLKEEKDLLGEKLKSLYIERKSLRDRISEIEEEKDNLLLDITDYQNNISVLESNIETLKGLLGNLESQGAEKDVEIERLKDLIKQYEGENAALKEKLVVGFDADTKDTIRLSPITVASAKAGKGKTLGALKSGKKGKVLEVNADYDFLVINLGGADGVKIGDRLFVFRGGDKLGTIVIEKVGDNASVGRALYKSLRDTVKKGDKVTY